MLWNIKTHYVQSQRLENLSQNPLNKTGYLIYRFLYLSPLNQNLKNSDYTIEE